MILMMYHLKFWKIILICENDSRNNECQNVYPLIHDEAIKKEMLDEVDFDLGEHDYNEKGLTHLICTLKVWLSMSKNLYNSINLIKNLS